MVAWNDARIIDESKRLDAAVDALITQKNKAQWMAFSVNVLFLIATFLSFVWTGSPASFGFLAVPGVSIAFNIVRDSRSGEHDEGRKDGNSSHGGT